MSTSQVSRFHCPHCSALYDLVRVESETVRADEELTCLACGTPLQARDGRYVLKYLLLDSPRSFSPRRALSAFGGA